MKKTLGLLAVIGAAAAIVAYKLKKEEMYEDFSELNEEDITEKILKKAEEVNYVEEEGETPPSIQSTSYPNLTEEDILHLNEISEELFSKLDSDVEDERTERPLQHTILFTNDDELQAYKKMVITEGYVVTGGENPTELIVLNITKVNPDEILSRIFSLANRAKEYNGKYINCILK